MSLLELFQKYFGDPEKEIPPEFDVMDIALPGVYNASIEQARVYHFKARPAAGVKLKLRLVPDDPEDRQTVYMMISRRTYVELLQTLGIKRTNDVTVLEGRIIRVKVVDSYYGEFPGVDVKILEQPCKHTTKQRPSTKRSKPTSSKTQSRRTGFVS